MNVDNNKIVASGGRRDHIDDKMEPLQHITVDADSSEAQESHV